MWLISAHSTHCMKECLTSNLLAKLCLYCEISCHMVFGCFYVRPKVIAIMICKKEMQEDSVMSCMYLRILTHGQGLYAYHTQDGAVRIGFGVEAWCRCFACCWIAKHNFTHIILQLSGLRFSGLRERGKGPQEWWYSSHPPTPASQRPLDLLFRFACSCARWRCRLLGSFLLPLRRLLKCSLFRLLQLLHPQRHPAFAVASCAFFPENAAALVASRPAAAASRRFTWGEFVAEASAGASPSTTPALLLSPLRCLRSTSLQVHVPPRRWRRTSIL